MKLLVLLVLSICFSACFSQKGVYPNSGVFVSFNSNFLTTFGNEFTTTVQNQINAYKVAQFSGKNGDISYTISNIQHSVKLEDLIYEQTDVNNYNIGWKTITFSISTDYNGCYKIKEGSELSFCEHGKVEITTSAAVSLTSSIVLKFDQTIPSIQCTSTTISPGSSISYSAHCTSKVCSKTHDIRNAVAKEFLPKVESAITGGINKDSSKYLPLFSTLRNLNMKINNDDLYLDSKGSLVESRSNTYMTLALQGGIVLKESNGDYIYPTEVPTALPSHVELETFKEDVAFTFTSFLFESLIEANCKSKLPMTITPSEVPSSSPVKLDTSDPFFNQTAPGLTEKYPNKPIDVLISLPGSPISVSLNSTGALLIIDLPFEFKVDSTIDAFQINFQFVIEITPSLKQVGNAVELTGTIDKIIPYAKLVSSSVGNVDTLGFIQIIQLMESFIKIPTFTIQNPLTKYTLSNVLLSKNDQFIQILSNLTPVKTNQINLI